MTHPIEQFSVFVDEAERLVSQPSHALTISKFLEFVREGERISFQPASPPPLNEFRKFVTQAMPLVVTEIKHLLPRLVERATLAERWLVVHDLLSIAGSSLVKDSYTELMGWALDPTTHPPSAQRRQQAWLKAVGLDEAICGTATCIPQMQMATNDGVPDLVLQYENASVVVEAKTGSAEHAVPSGNPQTIAYPESVRQSLSLSSDHKIEIVFITPNRRDAKNPKAKTTTYIEFALALAAALDHEEMPVDTRAAFAMLFTHFLTSPTTNGGPVREIATTVLNWSKQPDWSDDDAVHFRMNDLLEAAEILIPEHTR